MTEMPFQLKVGSITYRVVEWPYQETLALNADGQCDLIRRIIRVREDMNRDDKARTFLHEILHAAYNMGNLADGESEEKVVTVLANQMAQIWRDNPDFVAFMNDALSVDFG